MNTIKQPTKEQVRQYMEQRQAEQKVPPPMKEIRRRLGWESADRVRHDRLDHAYL